MPKHGQRMTEENCAYSSLMLTQWLFYELRYIFYHLNSVFFCLGPESFFFSLCWGILQSRRKQPQAVPYDPKVPLHISLLLTIILVAWTVIGVVICLNQVKYSELLPHIHAHFLSYAFDSKKLHKQMSPLVYTSKPSCLLLKFTGICVNQPIT